MLLICPDDVDIPQLGEFQRAGAVAVGFFDLHDDPLEMFRIVIGVVERQREILLLEAALSTIVTVPLTRTVSFTPGMKNNNPTCGFVSRFW